MTQSVMKPGGKLPGGCCLGMAGQLLSVLSLVLYVLIIISIIIFLSFFVLLNCLYFNPQFLLFFFLPILSPNSLGEDGLS